MAAQASPEDRRAIATYVLENTGTVEQLRSRVEELYKELAPPRRG
jgi:dephospho-CoA kinase